MIVAEAVAVAATESPCGGRDEGDDEGEDEYENEDDSPLVRSDGSLGVLARFASPGLLFVLRLCSSLLHSDDDEPAMMRLMVSLYAASRFSSKGSSEYVSKNAFSSLENFVVLEARLISVSKFGISLTLFSVSIRM